MMPVDYPRRVAGLLLRFAIWIAPHDTLDWGYGMLSELNHVQGDWAALIWAMGGARVLAKHVLLSVILPGRNRHTVSSAGELFAKEGSMRKTTLAIIGVCAVASFLFFLAPVFRQTLQVSLVQWHDLLHVHLVLDNQASDPGLEELARKAEQNHDAEGLAFVAVRDGNDSESARLAEEAVHLDPSLTWVYAVVAVLHPGLSEIDRWVPELERWDPQNGLPYFIVAEKIDLDQVDRKNRLLVLAGQVSRRGHRVGQALPRLLRRRGRHRDPPGLRARRLRICFQRRRNSEGKTVPRSNGSERSQEIVPVALSKLV
jgi:hypothetical protein